MKKKTIVMLLGVAAAVMFAGCANVDVNVTPKADEAEESQQEAQESEEVADAENAASDQEKADEVAALIDAIYVQERNDETDAQCELAKQQWDALTDAQKELVEGENADPDYFGRDTGDASKDDPKNGDDIGDNEILVVSFGTSFNDSRAEDIREVEDAIAKAYPDWAVRRAFTTQIIINHIQARDGEKIDNMDQALDRAVANGVKNLVIQPTHLMHGAEYDELKEAEALAAAKTEIIATSNYDKEGRITFAVSNVYSGTEEVKYGVLITRNGETANEELTFENAEVNSKFDIAVATFRAKDLGEGVTVKPYMIIGDTIVFGNQFTAYNTPQV